MKAKLLHFFAIFMAIIAAIPIMNAAQITYSVNKTPIWSKPGTYNAAKTIAVSKNKLYLLCDPTNDTKIAYVGENSNWTTFESGYGTWAHGFAFDNDDAGNIVMQGNGTGSATTKLVVYPAGATNNANKKEITITSPGGRTDFIRIQGNLLSGKGYVWFVPQNTQNIVRVNIENGKETGKTVWTHTLGNASSTEIAYMLDDGRIFLHHRKSSPNYAYLLTVPANGGAVTSAQTILSGNGASNLTSDVFNIQGTYLYVYNAGIAHQDIRFNVKNLATGNDIATNITPFDGKKTDGTTSYLSEFNSIGTIMRPIKVDVNTVDLYCYTPEHGASVYRVQANIIAEAVNSVSASRVEGTANNLKVSWTKPTTDVPTRYAVSYSSNGGSTWSTAVETTGLSHTFTGLPLGTYIVKVVPYYEHYLTSGGAKNSNSVELFAYTNPVTSLKAEIIGDNANEIKVSWGAPSHGTPTKYGIRYSINGGAYSAEEELTNTYKVYENQADATYKYAVRAYYASTNSWGETTESNSVTVINATGASISNLAYKYVKNTVTNIGRQDIVLMWEAPIGMVNTAVTGYKIYREGKLLATVGADVLTYTNTGVKQNYTYTVVPLFEVLTENSSYGQSVTTTEVTTTFVAPIISEIRNYEGYSLTELFYTMPDYAPYRPIYFNLYRDGKLIQGQLQAYNTLDESLVRSSETTIVKYQIEAVYGTSATATTPIDSVKSDEYTVTIAPRDWAKTGFILQEVYNVPIDEIAADKKPNLFDNNNYYRQGQFNTFDKKWYIAQRADNLSKNDETGKDGQISSWVEGTEGGIITYQAENADQVKSGYEKIFTKPAFENVGIAMDDAGTLFVRNNNKTKLSATGQDGFTIPTGDWFADAFERRITEGTFYKRNADGTYSEVATKLDLSALWTQNDWIEKMYFTGVGSDLANAGSGSNYGQVKGRSDYYHMWGDVLSAEGGYLVLSPSWTRCAFKVYIKGGAYQSHEAIEFDRYENGSYVLEPKTGTENYGFHLDGRDAVTVQIRSNGYFGVHTPWSADDWHPIFTAESRVNNAGGTSIQAFGKKITAEDVASEPDKYTTEDIGRHTGELLVITPQSMHSNNVGDFLISRAKKENANDFADEGTLLPSIPVVMKVQTDARSNSKATNANGNWFHAEVGTYASALNDNEECLDIYQYVPGTRFARYRLVQSNQFPQVTPVLNITTAYNDDITEITHFEGVATWNRPKGFGISTGSANAKVKSYIFEMYNSKNELVASTELPEVTKEDGSPIDDTYEYKFDYTAETGKDDIDFGRYSVNVQVKYETKDGVEHLSEPSFAEASHDYIADEASKRHIWMYKKANVTEEVWEYDEDKKDWVTVNKAFDNYRIELDFNAPTGTDEPVSYYTIHAYVNNKKDFIQITDFHLHKGAETVNGVTQAILDRDEKGNVIPTSQVPGTYIFDGENSWKAPFYKVGDNYEEVVGGQSRQTSVLTWHHKVPAGYYTSGVATTAEGDDITITDEPNNWKFVVVAHYAANNRSIAKSEEAQFSPELYDFITTGVEVVGDEASSLSIYPIPAHSTITIKANKIINSIVIYNEAGVELMSEMGDGDNMLDVNIEHLATGFYFVKVNNYEPVKIIKK